MPHGVPRGAHQQHLRTRTSPTDPGPGRRPPPRPQRACPDAPLPRRQWLSGPGMRGPAAGRPGRWWRRWTPGSRASRRPGWRSATGVPPARAASAPTTRETRTDGNGWRMPSAARRMARGAVRRSDSGPARSPAADPPVGLDVDELLERGDQVPDEPPPGIGDLAPQPGHEVAQRDRRHHQPAIGGVPGRRRSAATGAEDPQDAGLVEPAGMPELLEDAQHARCGWTCRASARSPTSRSARPAARRGGAGTRRGRLTVRLRSRSPPGTGWWSVDGVVAADDRRRRPLGRRRTAVRCQHIEHLFDIGASPRRGRQLSWHCRGQRPAYHAAASPARTADRERPSSRAQPGVPMTGVRRRLILFGGGFALASALVLGGSAALPGTVAAQIADPFARRARASASPAIPEAPASPATASPSRREPGAPRAHGIRLPARHGAQRHARDGATSAGPAASPGRCPTATRTCSCGPSTDAQASQPWDLTDRWRRWHGHGRQGARRSRPLRARRRSSSATRSWRSTRRWMPSSPRRPRACSCPPVGTWWASPGAPPRTAAPRLDIGYQLTIAAAQPCRRAVMSSPTTTSPRPPRSSDGFAISGDMRDSLDDYRWTTTELPPGKAWDVSLDGQLTAGTQLVSPGARRHDPRERVARRARPRRARRPACCRPATTSWPSIRPRSRRRRMP